MMPGQGKCYLWWRSKQCLICSCAVFHGRDLSQYSSVMCLFKPDSPEHD